MAKSHLARAPLEIRDMDLVNTRLFGEVDLPPTPLLSKLPDSIAKLDAHIGVHPFSIDLVEALYLVDALSKLNRGRTTTLPCRSWMPDSLCRRSSTMLGQLKGVTPCRVLGELKLKNTLQLSVMLW